MYKHLTFTDRLKIEAWEKIGTPKKKMAAELGVDLSTIYRELKRGRYTRTKTDLTTEECYSPDKAEEQYQEHLRAKGAGLKIGNDHVYAAYLEFKVSKEKYSPGAVLGEIQAKGLDFNTTISKTTFYRYIEQGVFLTLTNKDLPVKRNKDKHGYRKVRPARPPRGTSIEKRPPEVDTRESFGHWEMDSVVGKQGTSKALLVLTERKTRQEILRLMKDKTRASVAKALEKIRRETPHFEEVFRSITVDNGSEFADYKSIEQICGVPVFFCHPYSSCERGSNENNNKLVRRHYPKGFDFGKTTQAEVARIERWINNYPREMFHGYSSADLYEACLNSL